MKTQAVGHGKSWNMVYTNAESLLVVLACVVEMEQEVGWERRMGKANDWQYQIL